MSHAMASEGQEIFDEVSGFVSQPHSAYENDPVKHHWVPFPDE